MKCAIGNCNESAGSAELCFVHAIQWNGSPELRRWQRAKHDGAADAAFVDFVHRVSAEHRHADEGER